MEGTRTRKVARYGWKPDLPDQRDHLLAVDASARIPSSVDLRPKLPPVYDQGQLGSCTGNAIAAAYEYEAIRQGAKTWTPSRLFIYYNERVLEGSVDQDAGAEIRDGVKTLARQGVVPETEWPYDITKFANQPPAKAFTDALNHRALSYARTLPRNVRWALGHGGFPVVFGFTVYESFESQAVADTGVLNLPAAGEATVGGHAVLAVGYDDASQRILVRNSWGPDWGQKGYFTMPYAYILNPSLAQDFWTLKIVSDTATTA